MYNPTDSSLTRQAWHTQQQIIDDMGEGLGQITIAPDVDVMAARARAAADSKLAEIGVNKNYIATCGMGFLAAGFAGYVAGRIGVVPTVTGVGIAYALLKGMER